MLRYRTSKDRIRGFIDLWCYSKKFARRTVSSETRPDPVVGYDDKLSGHRLRRPSDGTRALASWKKPQEAGMENVVTA